MHFAVMDYKDFLFISESSQGGEGLSFLFMENESAMQRLSDLPRVTSESVAGTDRGALTQRRLLSAQGNATQLLFSLQPGLSHPPLLMTPVNSQSVTISQELSATPRRTMDFSGRCNYTLDETSPRKGV